MQEHIDQAAQLGNRVLEHLYLSRLSGKGHADTLELSAAVDSDPAAVAAACRRLAALGEVEVKADRGAGELLVSISPQGVRAVERAHQPEAGQAPNVTNNYHGPVGVAAAQYGPASTMHVRHEAAPAGADVAALLEALRTSAGALPAEDHDEARETLQGLEQGVRAGRLDRAQRAIETLGKLGSSSASFLTAVTQLAKALGLTVPGADT